MISYFDSVRVAHDVRRLAATQTMLPKSFLVEIVMRGKHRATLEAIFTDPVSGSIKWREVEALLIACGAQVSEGSGSRIRFTIGDETLFLHRPHPSPDTKRWAIREIRQFLVNVGIR